MYCAYFTPAEFEELTSLLRRKDGKIVFSCDQMGEPFVPRGFGRTADRQKLYFEERAPQFYDRLKEVAKAVLRERANTGRIFINKNYFSTTKDGKDKMVGRVKIEEPA